ncbi:MAG TPA: hypothetical protein VMS76_02010 [Planctomycetota bacterium]|nr:hypothetical protein [Planctomycetota bacterium]
MTTTHERAKDGAAETVVEPAAEPKATKAKGKKVKKAKAPAGDLTLAALAERYLHHMGEAGKSPGTMFSYGMELKTAQAELGAETLVASITPEQVQTFNDSPRVTRLKSGQPKAQPSIDKTRRVLRLALCWAQAEGLIATAPIPQAPEKA